LASRCAFRNAADECRSTTSTRPNTVLEQSKASPGILLIVVA
jgi:hypothetical protein